MAMIRALNQDHGSKADRLELLDCIRYQVIEIRGLNLPETELSKYYLPHGFIYPHRESTFDGLHLQGAISQIQYLDITFPPALKLIDSSRSSEFSVISK